MNDKLRIKSVVLDNMCNKKIVLFGAGKVAVEFYEKYKDIINIVRSVSNIESEWGEKRLCDSIDIQRYSKDDIRPDEYIIVCGPYVFNTIELQLSQDDFTIYENFVESGTADLIYQRKKIALFYGTCIMRDIYECIGKSSTFGREYAHIYIQIVKHQPIVVNRRLFHLKDICDLYIFMPKILDRDSIYSISSSNLPEDCTIISMSNVTVPIYWPQIDIKIDEYNDYYVHSYNEIRNLDFYHTMYRRQDNNIIKMLLENYSDEEIVSTISDEQFYSEKQINRNIKIALTMIQLAEKGVDITICDYIRDNYRNRMLYQNFVHPNKCIIWEYVRRLFIKLNLGVEELVELEEKSPEHIHQSGDVPIYPSVIKQLGLNWAKDMKYEIMTGRGIEYMNFKEYTMHFVEYERRVMDIMCSW